MIISMIHGQTNISFNADTFVKNFSVETQNNTMKYSIKRDIKIPSPRPVTLPYKTVSFFQPNCYLEM